MSAQPLLVFNVQRFSVYDGPGIRTTVFLKGCSLRCKWCHNPESLSAHVQVQFSADKCIGCHSCREACPRLDFDPPRFGSSYPDIDPYCAACRACEDACPAEAISFWGKARSTQELLDELTRDKDFYQRSGGGVTFSGGEPLLQVSQLKPLLLALWERDISCAIETAGHVPWPAFAEILELTDVFLFDIKAIDPNLHRLGTGADNRQILSNFEKLGLYACNTAHTSPIRIFVRTPIIPGFNDSEKAIEQLEAFLIAHPFIAGFEPMPFHSTGAHKYQSLAMAYPYANTAAPPADWVNALRDRFAAQGIPVCR